MGTEDVAKGVENVVVSQCGAGRGETVREREGVFERLEGKKGVVRVEMSAEKGVEMNGRSAGLLRRDGEDADRG